MGPLKNNNNFQKECFIQVIRANYFERIFRTNILWRQSKPIFWKNILSKKSYEGNQRASDNMLNLNRCNYLKAYFIQIFYENILSKYFIQIFYQNILSKYFTQATRELSGERRITRNLTELKHQLDPAHKVKNPDKSWLWNFQKQKSSGKLNGT